MQVHLVFIHSPSPSVNNPIYANCSTLTAAKWLNSSVVISGPPADNLSLDSNFTIILLLVNTWPPEQNSIHPPSSTYLTSDRDGRGLSRVFQASFSPATLSTFSRGTPRRSQARPGPNLGPILNMPGTPRGGVPEVS